MLTGHGVDISTVQYVRDEDMWMRTIVLILGVLAARFLDRLRRPARAPRVQALKRRSARELLEVAHPLGASFDETTLAYRPLVGAAAPKTIRSIHRRDLRGLLAWPVGATG